MPKLGLTMTEGLVSQWCVSEGARFSANEVLVIIETDKVAHEIEAPAEGQLDRILVSEGETVAVAAELGLWTLEGYAGTPATEADPAAAPPTVAGPTTAPLAPNSFLSENSTPTAVESFIRATPLARRIAQEQSVSLAHIQGTGPRDRIVAQDVRCFVEKRDDPIDNEHGTETAALITRTPPSAGLRTMATRLARAKREIPHFYLSIDVEVTGLLAMRRELNDISGRPRVSMTHLLVAAVAQALRAAPHMNRAWIDDEIVSYGSIDVGVAVDTDRGLTNPIVHDIGESSLYEIVRKVDEVVDRARAGRLKAADVRGGAITISNAGMHDVRYMTSIIPPDQGSIIGVGAVQECFRPDESGAPALKRELGLVLSADHRLHTGVAALGFLTELRRAIATPLALITSR